jgi:hypothetical protein
LLSYNIISGSDFQQIVFLSKLSAVDDNGPLDAAVNVSWIDQQMESVI